MGVGVFAGWEGLAVTTWAAPGSAVAFFGSEMVGTRVGTSAAAQPVKMSSMSIMKGMVVNRRMGVGK
jgi:hypothetical protein